MGGKWSEALTLERTDWQAGSGEKCASGQVQP